MNAKTGLISIALIATMLASAPAVATAADVVATMPVQEAVDASPQGKRSTTTLTPSEFDAAAKSVQTLAEESNVSTRDTAGIMSLREYESYRAGLRRQMRYANPNAAIDETEAGASDADRTLTINTGKGYGQGYRSRLRHGQDGAGMNGIRGGSMTPSVGSDR